MRQRFGVKIERGREDRKKARHRYGETKNRSRRCWEEKATRSKEENLGGLSRGVKNHSREEWKVDMVHSNFLTGGVSNLLSF